MRMLQLIVGFSLPALLSAQEYVEFDAASPRTGMRYALSIIGIIASFFLIKYRERVGEITGEAEWMKKVGGVYNVIVIVAIFIFFWSLATITGTTNIFLKPLTFLLPGSRNQNAF